jgi:preprotein translocase subunit YajC
VDGGFLLILVAMVAFMYLLLIRPQRQQQRRHTEMVQALKPGDEIITVGGLYGDVTGVEEDRVTLEIAEDVEVEVAKRAIATVVPPDALQGAEPEEESTDTEAPHVTPAPEEDAARR